MAHHGETTDPVKQAKLPLRPMQATIVVPPFGPTLNRIQQETTLHPCTSLRIHLLFLANGLTIASPFRSVPVVTSSSLFYLLMQSNFGDKYISPSFHVISDDSTLATPSISTFAGSSNSGGTSAQVPSDPPPGSTVGAPSSASEGGSGGAGVSGSSAATDPASSSSGHLNPIGPITPPNPVESPGVAGGPYPSPYPTAPPNPGNIGSVGGGLSPAEAAAQAAQKSGHAIAAAIAVPLCLMCFGLLLGGLAYMYRGKKKQAQQANEQRQAEQNRSVDGFTRLPQRPPIRSSSSMSSSSSKSSFMSEGEEKAFSGGAMAGMMGAQPAALHYQQPPTATHAAYQTVPSMPQPPLHAAYPFNYGNGPQMLVPGGNYVPLATQQYPASLPYPVSHIHPPALLRTLTPPRKPTRGSSMSSASSTSSYSTSARSSAKSVLSYSQAQLPPLAIHDPFGIPAQFQSSQPHQPQAWSALFPTNPTALTPPALPNTGTMNDAKSLAAYHGTMQTILNSYMGKALPPPPHGGPSGASGNEGGEGQASEAPSINYSTRPAVDLDQQHRESQG